MFFSLIVWSITEIPIKAKFSFLLCHSTLFIPQPSMPFILLCIWIPYDLLYILRKSVVPSGHGPWLFVFAFPSIHLIYGFYTIRGPLSSDKLIWFLSRIIFYCISNIPAQRSLYSSLYRVSTHATYQIDHKFLCLPKCILNFTVLGTQGQQQQQQNGQTTVPEEQGKERREVAIDQR